MAVVPITAAKGPSVEPQSDTDMAIAAALLHREGAFNIPDDAISPGKPYQGTAISGKANVWHNKRDIPKSNYQEYNAKQGTPVEPGTPTGVQSGRVYD